MPEPTTCAECRHSRLTFSDEETEGVLLKCHRFPATLFVLEDEVRQAYPDADEPCGEFDA